MLSAEESFGVEDDINILRITLPPRDEVSFLIGKPWLCHFQNFDFVLNHISHVIALGDFPVGISCQEGGSSA
jgi:hypothetical protein